ncbi:Double-stranded RNA-binding protein 6 [Apostasia shenzhenica]|uniref:Double-stranded RNA-binding protein 6 n=1 Tax=Apostasia shenzhenica TaxID=1088818 RepID=A0A2I0ACX0_9ASPA|nr:Double-stranded RNA-binding protein 6 [Apostasia shenzhenica]
MYKNQLQELAQRSCFSLPSYTCLREGPDHAPRFKATVSFNGEIFESPAFCTTLRQAEHAAAEVALNALSSRGPSHSLAARILDETGVYKNLLQEVAQRVGAPLPSYTTYRSGHWHHPVFTCTVELAEISFNGEPAKSKKQAEKNAAMAAWKSLKQSACGESSSLIETENNDELEQITIARALLSYRLREKRAMTTTSFADKFLLHSDKRTSHTSYNAGSKLLPVIRPRTASRIQPASPVKMDDFRFALHATPLEHQRSRGPQFPAAEAPPYMPVQHFTMPYTSVAPPVTMRTAVPVFSSPPLPPPPAHQRLPYVMNPPPQIAPPVHVRRTVPVFAAPPAQFPSPPPAAVSKIIEQPTLTTITGVYVKEEQTDIIAFKGNEGKVGAAVAAGILERSATELVIENLGELKL